MSKINIYSHFLPSCPVRPAVIRSDLPLVMKYVATSNYEHFQPAVFVAANSLRSAKIVPPKEVH